MGLAASGKEWSEWDERHRRQSREVAETKAGAEGIKIASRAQLHDR